MAKMSLETDNPQIREVTGKWNPTSNRSTTGALINSTSGEISIIESHIIDNAGEVFRQVTSWRNLPDAGMVAAVDLPFEKLSKIGKFIALEPVISEVGPTGEHRLAFELYPKLPSVNNQ